jgi:hypothetical protein
MKGLIFTELVEFVESSFNYETVDNMLQNANLPHSGAYTQAGNYPFDELVSIIISLNRITKIEINKLLFLFGDHIFDKIKSLYPSLIEEFNNPLDFIEKVDEIVHVEVKKLYSDVDLPRFFVKFKSEKKLILLYQSEKKLEALAHGLMIGCARYYNKKINVEYHIVSNHPHQVEFTINEIL